METLYDDVAGRLRRSIGIEDDETEDPRIIAVFCGLRLAPARMIGAAVYHGAIYYDAAAPLAERKALIATELGRWALMREGLPAIEDVARRVGLVLVYGFEHRRSGSIPILSYKSR